MRRLVLSLSMIVALAACGSILAVDPLRVAGLEAHGASRNIVLRNTLDRGVHYVLRVEGGSVPDLQPDPKLWPSVPVATTVRIPYGELGDDVRPLRSVTVYAWNELDGYAHGRIVLR